MLTLSRREGESLILTIEGMMNRHQYRRDLSVR